VTNTLNKLGTDSRVHAARWWRPSRLRASKDGRATRCARRPAPYSVDGLVKTRRSSAHLARHPRVVVGRAARRVDVHLGVCPHGQAKPPTLGECCLSRGRGRGACRGSWRLPGRTPAGRVGRPGALLRVGASASRGEGGDPDPCRRQRRRSRGLGPSPTGCCVMCLTIPGDRWPCHPRCIVGKVGSLVSMLPRGRPAPIDAEAPRMGWERYEHGPRIDREGLGSAGWSAC
jgi:hypothetical protein